MTLEFGEPDIEGVLTILDKHFPNSTWPKDNRRQVAIGLRHAATQTAFFGIPRAHRDPKELDRTAAALRKALAAFDALSTTGQADLDNSFRFTTFGDAKQTLSDWNLQIHARSAIEMLVSACADVQEHRKKLAEMDIRPTKADVVGMALIDACRRTWWAATGEEAPRYLVKAGDIGGDPSRNPSPFDLFTRDVFAFHGRRPDGIPAAMDAWRRARDDGGL